MVAEMVETPTDTATAVEVSAIALRDALGACLLSVSKDAMEPVLGTVHVVSDGTSLTFTSTDRYRLTMVTTTVSTPGPAFDVLVESADAKRLQTAVKASAKFAERNGYRGGAFLSVEGGRLALRDLDGGVTSARTYTDGEFPHVERIIPDSPAEGAAPTAHTVAFNPRYFGDLCKMPGRRHNEPVKLSFPKGPGQACVSRWTHSDDASVEFVHVIMPVRSA